MLPIWLSVGLVVVTVVAVTGAIAYAIDRLNHGLGSANTEHAKDSEESLHR